MNLDHGNGLTSYYNCSFLFSSFDNCSFLNNASSLIFSISSFISKFISRKSKLLKFNLPKVQFIYSLYMLSIFFFNMSLSFVTLSRAQAIDQFSGPRDILKSSMSSTFKSKSCKPSYSKIERLMWFCFAGLELFNYSSSSFN